MLRAAVIGLQSTEFQAWCVRYAARECGSLPARRHAAALHADLDFDQRAELHAEILRHARRGVDLFGRIETQRNRRIVRQRGETAQLAVADNLIAYKHVPHATTYQRFSLADFL